MSVANVVMFEFETKADLENWADWYKNDGPFPNNEISLFVQTGETSAFGIATYPSEEAREAGGKIRDDLHNNSEMAFKVKENKKEKGLSFLAQPSTDINKFGRC